MGMSASTGLTIIWEMGMLANGWRLSMLLRNSARRSSAQDMARVPWQRCWMISKLSSRRYGSRWRAHGQQVARGGKGPDRAIRAALKGNSQIARYVADRGADDSFPSQVEKVYLELTGTSLQS